MNLTISQQPSPDLTGAVVKRLAQIAILIGTQAASLFLSSGRLAWPEAWAYLGLYVGVILINAALMLPHHAGLAAERANITRDVRGWDRVILLLVLVSGGGLLIVAGLDERWNWSPPFTGAVQVGAWVVMALGFGLFSWGMLTNAFFSSVVRIQSDRGHAVVTGGPYRLVRHPGYIGIIAYSLAAPLMFGSLWALMPALQLCGTIVARTKLEDETLQNELPGYKAYAARVRFRLLPGIW